MGVEYYVVNHTKKLWYRLGKKLTLRPDVYQWGKLSVVVDKWYGDHISFFSDQHDLFHYHNPIDGELEPYKHVRQI